jgi:hypothetical protein
MRGMLTKVLPFSEVELKSAFAVVALIDHDPLGDEGAELLRSLREPEIPKETFTTIPS